MYYPTNAAAPCESRRKIELILVMEGNADEIDLVLSHSRHEDRLNDPKDVPQENLRFHVKWKGYSHLHNTEEVYAFLKNYKGFKKVENYIAKVWLVDQRFRHPEPNAAWKPTQEEMEQYEIDTERNKELLESYKVIERILDEKEERRDEGVVSLFFCKWTSELIFPTRLTTDLQYADCTWEAYDDIKDGAQAAIEDFHVRQRRTTVPGRSVPYAIHARPTYHKINEDPAYLTVNGGALKPFQLTGLNWLAYVWSKGENGILADEVGQATSWILTIDGFGKNSPIGILLVIPIPHTTAIRAIPRRRAAIHDFGVANAIPSLGARPQRNLLYGFRRLSRCD